MRHEFTFDGVSSSLYSVFISGEGTFNGTARDVSQVEVPGRNGSLILDNGRYQNIDLTYPAFIVRDFRANFAALRAFLLSRTGYRKLADDYHSEEFRLARYKGNIAPKLTQLNREGSFEISFDCKPQRFLVSGEIAASFTQSGRITNPTLYEAKPVLRVYGTGQIGIGDETITITAHDYPYIDIDTDIQDAFYGTSNANSYVSITGDTFPGLHAGDTGIEIDGPTRLEITPRWWTL